MGKSFLISNYETALEKDKEPFLINEKAFPVLEDAYVFRGRVKRRFGFNLFDGGHLNSRLRLEIGEAKTGVLNTFVPFVLCKIFVWNVGLKPIHR